MEGIIAPYLLTLANRNDPISVTMPKVAKASTIMAVLCRCHWHYRLKYNANVNYPLDVKCVYHQVKLYLGCPCRKIITYPWIKSIKSYLHVQPKQSILP